MAEAVRARPWIHAFLSTYIVCHIVFLCGLCLYPHTPASGALFFYGRLYILAGDGERERLALLTLFLSRETAIAEKRPYHASCQM